MEFALGSQACWAMRSARPLPASTLPFGKGYIPLTNTTHGGRGCLARFATSEVTLGLLEEEAPGRARADARQQQHQRGNVCHSHAGSGHRHSAFWLRDAAPHPEPVPVVPDSEQSWVLRRDPLDHDQLPFCSLRKPDGGGHIPTCPELFKGVRRAIAAPRQAPFTAQNTNANRKSTSRL